MNIVELARKVATEAHIKDFRWDKQPYITHPETIAATLKQRLVEVLFDGVVVDVVLNAYYKNGYGLNKQEFIQVCEALSLTHDVVEDHPKEYPMSRIIEIFRANTTIPDNMVDAYIHGMRFITKSPNESYKDYVLRVKQNCFARLVKIFDLKHNMSDLKEGGSRKDKYDFALFILSDPLS
jgi:(p)ppGpp synthase/HD superfamily hydrolase